MLFLRIFHSTFSFLQLWNPQNFFWDRKISSNRISSFFIIIYKYPKKRGLIQENKRISNGAHANNSTTIFL